jgi:hypothetical protein
VVKFRDIVRHNLDVKTRRCQRWGEDPEDRLNHEPTVAAMIMVSPDDVQELDRYVELHTGTSRRELMEEAVGVLCESFRRARKEREESIEREQRQKYELAMVEKRTNVDGILRIADQIDARRAEQESADAVDAA